MPDLDKVIQEIKMCTSGGYPCENCSHYGHGEDLVGCMDELLSDALELLKEQKPKPQRYKEHDPFHLPFCPNEDCNAVMDAYWNFCPYCGASMVWDEERDEKERSVKWNEI